MRLGGMKSIFGIIGSLVMAKSPSIAASTLQFRTKVPSGSNMVFTQTSVAIRYSFLIVAQKSGNLPCFRRPAPLILFVTV